MTEGFFHRQRLDSIAARKAVLLAIWFFVTIGALWLLKAVRVAALLVRLGAQEIPYVRLASVGCVALVVMAYSAALGRVSRVGMVRWVNGLFAAVLVLGWVAMRLAGPALSASRPFVWGVYIFAEVYASVAVGLFWTYANDIVTQSEADRIYGIVGLGGILGGAAAGGFVDVAANAIPSRDLLLIAGVLAFGNAALASLTEALLRPPKRPLASIPDGMGAAFSGAREVLASRYLMLLVGIVVAYEFVATLTDFGINVVLEHTYREEAQLARMYGRLGWVVSATAVFSQLVLVPLLLPYKRVALMVPPMVLVAGIAGVTVWPMILTVMVLAAADRGINYSLQEATVESLYVSMGEDAKYRAKAFIDMFVDRAAKAVASVALLAIIAAAGASVRLTLAVALCAMLFWLLAARNLGAYWPSTETVAPDATAPTNGEGSEVPKERP